MRDEPVLPLLSVVVPVFDEEEGIAAFYERTKNVLAGLEGRARHELIFVNDGSADGSLVLLNEMAAKDERVIIIDLSRNFGHQLAITAGMDYARGDAVVVIDADLQDPPEVIAAMLDRWEKGYKVVYGRRTHRAGETRFKVITAKTFYRLLNRLSDTPLPLDSGDFRLLDRKVVDVLGDIREENRYIRGLVSWAGFSQDAVDYERDQRFAGETKYPLRKMVRFAVDALTSFSDRPLRLATQLGLFFTSATLVYGTYVIIARLLFPERSEAGFASLMVAVLFLGGVQLLSIGLLGEYIGRIYRESKNRPLYVVNEVVDEGFREEGAGQ
jgi:dolichol-phosphate mannosyltransferase